METCIICLEEFTIDKVKKICTTCRESAICGGCMKGVVESGHFEILSNCPVCKSPTGFSYTPDLTPAYQALTFMIWGVTRGAIPSWKPVVVLYSTYSILRGLVRKQSIDHPMQLVKTWNVFNFVTHVPYYVYDLYTRPSSEDEILNTYISFQVLTPTILGLGILTYKKLRSLFT